MTEPEKKDQKPGDKPKEQKAPPKGYKHPSPSYADAVDGLGWFMIFDGIGDIVGSLLD